MHPLRVNWGARANIFSPGFKAPISEERQLQLTPTIKSPTHHTLYYYCIKVTWNNATHSLRVLSKGFQAQIPNEKYNFVSIKPITPTLTGAASAFKFCGKMSHIVGQLGSKIRQSISPGLKEQLLNEANLCTHFIFVNI